MTVDKALKAVDDHGQWASDYEKTLAAEVRRLRAERDQTPWDKHVEAVILKHRERAARGLKKYGTTTERSDLTIEQWLDHAQEEAMDFAVYLETLREQIVAQQQQIDRTHEQRSQDFARRVPVEQRLLDAASGKKPLPTADECRELALRLGKPHQQNTKAPEKGTP